MVQPFKILPTTGGSIDPKHVVGRDLHCRNAFELLVGGNHLLVSDPRRMGKTAWLRYLATQAPDGVVVVFIDYEGVDTIESFLLRTIAELRRHTGMTQIVRSAFRDLFEDPAVEYEGIKLKVGLRTLAPIQILERALQAIDARFETGRLLVIAADEVPLAIANIANNPAAGPTEARSLLQTLRRFRLRAESRTRWIVTGSVGFHHVLRQARSTEGEINDLHTFAFGPLSPTNAALLAQCLLLGIDRPPDAVLATRMAEITNGIPFLLHHLAHHMKERNGNLTIDDADAALRAFIANRDDSKAVTHFVTRLAQYYAPQVTLAERILDHLATTQDPPTFEQLHATIKGKRDQLLRITDMLVDDHYIFENTHGGLEWRYSVIRRIWRVRRGLAR